MQTLFFFLYLPSILSVHSTEASATTVSLLQVLPPSLKVHTPSSTGRAWKAMNGCGWRDRLMIYIVHVWLNLNTVMSEERHNATVTLRNCSYNAMVLPSETRDNALKQL